MCWHQTSSFIHSTNRRISKDKQIWTSPPWLTGNLEHAAESKGSSVLSEHWLCIDGTLRLQNWTPRRDSRLLQSRQTSVADTSQVHDHFIVSTPQGKSWPSTKFSQLVNWESFEQTLGLLADQSDGHLFCWPYASVPIYCANFSPGMASAN